MRDALYLVVAVIVLILVADWISRRAVKDVKDALPSLPSTEDVVAAPGTIIRGFWDWVKETGSGTPNDAAYISQDEAKKRAASALAARRKRLANFGQGLQ